MPEYRRKIFCGQDRPQETERIVPGKRSGDIAASFSLYRNKSERERAFVKIYRYAGGQKKALASSDAFAIQKGSYVLNQMYDSQPYTKVSSREDVKVKNQNNDTFSLAQGRYPWGLNKIQANDKFVIKIGRARRLFQFFYYIVPTLTEEQLKYVYADEADILNVALFGKTAGQWRKENPSLKGNIRDYATIEQILVIANMESLNAYLIEQHITQSERLKQFNNMARPQMRVREIGLFFFIEPK